LNTHEVETDVGVHGERDTQRQVDRHNPSRDDHCRWYQTCENERYVQHTENLPKSEESDGSLIRISRRMYLPARAKPDA